MARSQIPPSHGPRAKGIIRECYVVRAVWLSISGNQPFGSAPDNSSPGSSAGQCSFYHTVVVGTFGVAPKSSAEVEYMIA